MRKRRMYVCMYVEHSRSAKINNAGEISVTPINFSISFLLFSLFHHQKVMALRRLFKPRAISLPALAQCRFFDGRPMVPESQREANLSVEEKNDFNMAVSGQYAEHKPRAIMFVNRRPVEIIPQEENLLEVLEREGIRVPKFCYHPGLSVAGNCRMCMVQVEGTQNMVVACATAVLPGMSILTDTRLCRDAREGNVELILINHPNDCPICEQAINCELQHITMQYGTDMPRFREEKSSINDFYFDPHTRVVLQRCINCTRCVRFLNECTQDYSLGMIGRGGLCEISTFLSELEVTTEHAMGAAALCPVGCLNTPTLADESATVNLVSLDLD